ncbi:MAG: 6,7-dimethyl-8-ribityllumazine synthase [Spirochaetes bacterium]|nr:6,7-dimethyl-8-ribityllumazine synthase [Spirochaetota bacterium]
MIYEGESDARGLKVLILVSRFNDLITRKLLDGARDGLRRMGAAEADVDTAFTPGAYELPFAASTAAKSGRWQAIIALGCVIKGDTAHFDYVAGEAASGISRAMNEGGVPVAFGVLTVDTLEQALDRCGGKHGNKGAEAASVAVEMARLAAKLKK